ncbi:MAG: hypothetical protein AAGI01_14895, partial [Myxococcota bacterium]
LTRLLATELGVGEQAVEVMLSRGPLTVEADLTQPEARALVKRLQGRGIPSRALGPGQDASRPVSGSPPQRVELFEQPTLDFVSDLQHAMDHAFDGQVAPGSVQPRFGVPAPASEPLGPTGDPTTLLFSVPEVPGEPEPAEALTQSAPPNPEPMHGGWGALFPGMERPDAPASRAELDAASTELWYGSSELPQEPVALGLGASPTLGAWRDVLPADAKAPEVRQEPARLEFGQAPVLQEDPTDRLPAISSEPLKAPALRGLADERVPAATSTPRVAGKPDLIQVFAAGEGEPHTPQGYDARGPHSASIAMTLSIFAPGAGQVFNGQDAEASHYGSFFFLIKPWIDSVRKAREDGQLIEDYKLPRPEDGNFARAMRYMAVWYCMIAVVVYVFSWTAKRTIAQWDKDPGPTPEEIALRYDALDAAAPPLYDALLRAGAAAKEAAEQIPPDELDLSKMSNEERATRLYIIGLEHCRANDYPACFEFMERVTKLDTSQHDAYRLQTWATMCIAGTTSEMPEVEETRTLEEFDFEIDTGDGPAPLPGSAVEKPDEQASAPAGAAGADGP